MGGSYAAIHRGGIGLPVVGGGGSLMTHSAGSVTSQRTALTYVLASEPYRYTWHLWHLKQVMASLPHIKGAQVWDFSSLRFYWFLWHKVSIGRGLEGWNKKLIFLKCGPDTNHFIFASVCAAYASNDFWLWVSAKKKVVSDPPEVYLNVSK